MIQRLDLNCPGMTVKVVLRVLDVLMAESVFPIYLQWHLCAWLNLE